MTAKRFVDYFDKDHNYIIQDLQNEDEYQVGFVNCDEDVFLELINQLSDENEQLKTKNFAYIQDIEVFKEENTHLKLENEELRERNDRQAKQLDRLYQLISQKDWRTLSDIMDDFKRCEEQLQRESGTYW